VNVFLKEHDIGMKFLPPSFSSD